MYWQFKYSIWIPSKGHTQSFDIFKDMMDFYLSNKDIALYPRKN